MRNKYCWIWIVGLACLVVGCGYTDSKSNDANSADDNGGSMFTVNHYDPLRDPVKDLDRTVQLASKSKKRILLEVGGKW